MDYKTFCQKQAEKMKAFPFIHAHNIDEMVEALNSKGMTIDDLDKLVEVGNGVFILKQDQARYSELISGINREKEEAVSQDKTGDGFIYEMFLHALEKNKCRTVRDANDTLEELGYTAENIESSPALKRGVKKAFDKLNLK